MLAYCSRLGLPVGHLIYASGNLPAAPYVLRGSDVVLHVHNVDMGQTVDELELAVATPRVDLLEPAGRSE